MEPNSLGVAIATAGRPAMVRDVMDDIERQTVVPHHLVLSVPDEASLPAVTDGWDVVIETHGLAAQRNAAFHRLDGKADIVFFFDDDSVVRPDFAERAAAWFARVPDLVALHGTVLADGAVSGEIPMAEARTVLESSLARRDDRSLTRSRVLYGCNMVVHRGRAPQEDFDDRLPLYSWLEDHDLARRLLRIGPVGKAGDCYIVHRAATSGGRTNHGRLGYSQVMNPAYFFRKGSFPLWLTVWEIFRPSSKNLVKSLSGSERDWRRERLKGNAQAWGDILRGRFTPERIRSL